MSWLSSTGSSAASVPSLTPDALVNKLTPMLGLSKRIERAIEVY